MKEQKKLKLEKSLLKNNLIEENELLVDAFEMNYISPVFGSFGTWSRGYGYFTDKKIIHTRGFRNIMIEYKDIIKMERSRQFFLPIALKITYKKEDKIVTDKISLMKRENWIKFIEEKQK